MRIGYSISRVFFWLWLKTLHFIEYHGRENFPEKGPFICVANHVSFGDPPVVALACHTEKLYFMAKKELFYDKQWGWWYKWVDCIPIARDKKDYRATKEALKLLNKGKSIAIFPEGTRSETGELKEPELGAGFLAIKSKAPVIPIYLVGTKEAKPVGKSYKAFIPVKVYIGKSVDFKGAEKIEDKKEKYKFASNKIMEAIGNLKSIYENNRV